MISKKTWGGKWTEEKRDAFEKYVKAYLTINKTAMKIAQDIIIKKQ